MVMTGLVTRIYLKLFRYVHSYLQKKKREKKKANNDPISTQIMVGSNLSDVQLQQIVDKTFIEADENRYF